MKNKQPPASKEVEEMRMTPSLKRTESCPEFNIFNSIGFMAEQAKASQKNSPKSVTATISAKF